MQYFVEWEGKTYPLNTSLDVPESKVILDATGITFGKYKEILFDPTHEDFVLALQAVMWLMKTRSGQPCSLLDQNFDIDEWYLALMKGMALALREAGHIVEELSEVVEELSSPAESPKKTVRRTPKEKLLTPDSIKT